MLIDPTVAQQRVWFKAADAKAVSAEDALLQNMLPAKLQRQLQQLNQELALAGHEVSPLPSDLKTILLTSIRVESEPMVFVEPTAKQHQALFAGVRNNSHIQLNTVGHNIMLDFDHGNSLIKRIAAELGWSVDVIVLKNWISPKAELFHLTHSETAFS